MEGNVAGIELLGIVALVVIVAALMLTAWKINEMFYRGRKGGK